MPLSPQFESGGAVPVPHAVRSVAWNYAGYAFQIAINLGLTWYIVRKITVVEYGLFLFVMSLSASLYLLDLGLLSVLVPAFAEAATAGSDRVNDLLSTTFLTLAGLGAIGALLFCGLALILPGPFKIPPSNLHQAFLIVIVAGCIILVGLPAIAVEEVYQASHRFDRTNQIQLGAATLLLALSVVVLVTGHGIVALALVQLVVALVRLLAFAAILPATVPGIHLSLTRFRFELLKPLIHLSKWAFLSNASSSVFDMLIWIMLGSFGSMEQAALFGLANKLPRQLWNLIDKGGAVAFPQLSAAFARGDRRSLQRVYLKSQRLLSGGVLPFVALGCFAALPLMKVWAGSQYAAAAPVLQILLLGVATHVTGYCSEQLLYATGEIKKAAAIALCEYGVSLALAALLVPRYGAAGLAAGMAAGQILVNCTWLTSAACKLSGTSRQTLLKAIFSGLALPVAILCAAMVAIWGASKFLAPSWKLITAVITGCVYAAVWGRRNLLPARGAESESAA